ncbi:MAG: tetratricopeptide repeat protein [Myxococcota bacterium]|nr:tetratricopeptide repeat protein [Myxococcota bacterium]
MGRLLDADPTPQLIEFLLSRPRDVDLPEGVKTKVIKLLLQAARPYLTDNHREPALALLQETLELAPDNGILWNLYATILREVKRFEEALSALRKAWKCNPDNGDILRNLLDLELVTGRTESALARTKEYLLNPPPYPPLLRALASVCIFFKLYEDANFFLEKALGLAPDDSDILFDLGLVCGARNKTKKAREFFSKAERSSPDNFQITMARCLTLPVLYSSESEILRWRAIFEEGLAEIEARLPSIDVLENSTVLTGVLSRTNFTLPYQGRADRELHQRYAKLVQSVTNTNFEERLRVGGQSSSNKPRLGFVTNFLWHHTVGKEFGGWFTGIDRDLFEVHFFTLGGKFDSLTEKCRQYGTSFTTLPRDFGSASVSIRDTKLDVIIYPELGMDGFVFGLASLRLAPIQCAAWGHPVTSGFSTIDYFLSSELMEPPSGQKHYNAELICLPGISIDYPQPKLPSRKPTRDEFCLPQDATLYLMSQSLFKLLPQYDSVYAKILQQVPNAHLVLISHSTKEVTLEFKRRFMENLSGSVDKPQQRFTILEQMPFERFLGLNHICDIYLDSIGWSGGNTCLEALATHLPLVTYPLELMRSQHTAAILRQMGLTDFIAASPDEYVSLAVRLGLDIEKRLEYRAQLADAKKDVFSDKRATRFLENFLLGRLSNMSPLR